MSYTRLMRTHLATLTRTVVTVAALVNLALAPEPATPNPALVAPPVVLDAPAPAQLPPETTPAPAPPPEAVPSPVTPHPAQASPVVLTVAPAAPQGPWQPSLATDHEPAAPIKINWTGAPGPSSPDGIDGYQCWDKYGYPVPQPKSQPTCPPGWGGRPPEHPVPTG